MKTIIQLLIAALVINAAVQAARSVWADYEFKDAAERQVRLGTEKTIGELHRKLVRMAEESGVDVEWDDIVITPKTPFELAVDVSYVDEVEFIPRFYMRPWAYEWSVSGERMKPIKNDERR
jgi:hypothetical protein